MKNKILHISYILLAVLAFAACKDNTSDLSLGGDCAVTALTLDTYKGVIDTKTQTVVVNVPEVFDESAMTVTELTLSAGATANIAKGQKLNMRTPRTLRVTNGDVFVDWTVSVRHDEARIYQFRLNGKYNGVINEEQKTISVYVPAGTDLKALVPSITLSEGASVTPLSGVATDFTQPVAYTVTNNTAKAVYTVTVTEIDAPEALFVGIPASKEELSIEELTACEWMLANVPKTLYASFGEIAAGTVDMSKCKVIWWHFHRDGGVDGKERFEAAAPEALAAQVQLRNFYNGGGSFLFTRYATNMPAFIGAVKNEGCPNNCWGGAEASPEFVGGPWSFFITGKTSHPLYQNLMQGEDANQVYTCDKGYGITNSTAQWHIGADWGGYESTDYWRTATGGVDLGWGGDGAIVVWEFLPSDGRGRIVCIGSGCYDWFTTATVEESFHANIAKMTRNAFDYLTQ